MFKEITGDIFSTGSLKPDAICITTNGDIKNDGCNVMGAGVAKSAKQALTGLDKTLGNLIIENGNVVQPMACYHFNNNGVLHPTTIISFPTKYTWKESSSLFLIESSLAKIVLMADEHNWKKIILPRPGCSNGGLNWLSQVKPLLIEYLDDRFYIIQKG